MSTITRTLLDIVNYTTLGRTNLTVSKLGLGTAEIGFEYGLGDRPVPPEQEAISLLQEAVAIGITFFDTAHYYGLSEERIAKSGILKNPDIIVETKCAKFLEKGEYFSLDILKQKIREEVETSLTTLQIEALPILMLHGPHKEHIEKGELIEILSTLKQEGKIRFTGVSTRGEEAPLSAIASDFFDVIQVAYNIADQRMSGNVLPRATEKNVGVVSRSTLLKGAFTSLREKLSPQLTELTTCADQASEIAHSIGIDLPTLALRFSLNNPAIGTVLVGTNKLANIKQAVDAVEAGALSEEIMNALTSLALTDPAQIDPAQWPKEPK